MYNPVNAVTDSTGRPYNEITSPENCRSGGLGPLITHAKTLGEVSYRVGPLSKLLTNRFSLVAYDLMNDLGLKPNDTVEFGSADGYKCIRFKGTEYREKKGSIVVV